MTTTELLDDIIRREGGLVNDPADRGGLTNFGITQTSWTQYRDRFPALQRVLMPESVADITEKEARVFYLAIYITPATWIASDELTALFVDSSINHGSSRAVRWMQLAADVEPDGMVGPITRGAVNARTDVVYREMLRTRFSFYTDIVLNDKTQLKFLRGWIRRACEFIR